MFGTWWHVYNTSCETASLPLVFLIGDNVCGARAHSQGLISAHVTSFRRTPWPDVHIISRAGKF